MLAKVQPLLILFSLSQKQIYHAYMCLVHKSTYINIQRLQCVMGKLCCSNVWLLFVSSKLCKEIPKKDRIVLKSVSIILRILLAFWSEFFKSWLKHVLSF